MLTLHGKQVILNNHMVIKTQVRKHRKKRINKKWAKKYGFTVTPQKDVFVMGNTIIMHPATWSAIKKNI